MVDIFQWAFACINRNFTFMIIFKWSLCVIHSYCESFLFLCISSGCLYFIVCNNGEWSPYACTYFFAYKLFHSKALCSMSCRLFIVMIIWMCLSVNTAAFTEITIQCIHKTEDLPLGICCLLILSSFTVTFMLEWLCIFMYRVIGLWVIRLWKSVIWSRFLLLCGFSCPRLIHSYYVPINFAF